MSESENNPVGRPTKYYPEIIQELIEWFDQEPYEIEEIPHYTGKKDENGEPIVKWTEKKKVPRQLPTLINFARHKKIGLSTIYDWINPEHTSYQRLFSETYKRIAKDAQKEVLIQNGLTGGWNPLFSKFVAVNMTDMRDKQDMDITDNTMVKTILDALPPDVQDRVKLAIKAKMDKK